jgi:two-component system, NarL family, nitrate/nitrite response regulator NarL
LLISDESSLFCKGLEAIFTARNVRIVDEVRILGDALATLRSVDKVDVLLCDLASDMRAEFETLAQIKREFPQLIIIILTNRIEPALLTSAVAAGVDGILTKDVSVECLCLSIELAILGEKVFPLDRSLLETRPDKIDSGSLTPGHSMWILLSTREKQILNCLVDGFSNKKIAEDLSIAEGTVKVHLKKLLRKLSVENRTQAALWGKLYSGV